MGGRGTWELHVHIGGAAAVNRDGRVIHRKVAAAVTHNSDSQ